MTPKPIFTVGLPLSETDIISDIEHMLSKKLEDYHVLLYVSKTATEPVFECFYNKDITDIEITELQNIVYDSLVR